MSEYLNISVNNKDITDQIRWKEANAIALGRKSLMLHLKLTDSGLVQRCFQIIINLMHNILGKLQKIIEVLSLGEAFVALYHSSSVKRKKKYFQSKNHTDLNGVRITEAEHSLLYWHPKYVLHKQPFFTFPPPLEKQSMITVKLCWTVCPLTFESLDWLIRNEKHCWLRHRYDSDSSAGNCFLWESNKHSSQLSRYFIGMSSSQTSTWSPVPLWEARQQKESLSCNMIYTCWITDNQDA